MGTMQPPQPVQAAGGMSPPRLLKRFAAHALRGWLVETRRNPLLRFPAMVQPNELFQIPAPFNNLAGRWIDSDEAEGIDSIERQFMKDSIRDIRRDGRAHGIDDFAPADGLADNPGRDGIPVDKRKCCAVVVHGDPRSTAGFRRGDYG